MTAAAPPARHRTGRPLHSGLAVGFLERGTAFVTLSMSPFGSPFTAPLAAALIGDRYSPLDWLEFR